MIISDEHGPYVYKFDPATGARTDTYTLPSKFAIGNSSSGAAEISGNTVGRVTNKGMEGLAITPDGQTLVGFMQRLLLQDGGDGAAATTASSPSMPPRMPPTSSLTTTALTARTTTTARSWP